MKFLIKLSICLCLLSFNALNAEENNNWTIILNGNYSLTNGLSDAMKGDKVTFRSDLITGFDNNKYYPFGEDNTVDGQFNLLLFYHLNESSFSLYSGIGNSFFYLDERNTESSQVLLLINSLKFGSQYNIDLQDQLDLFVRASINFNLIDGFFDYQFWRTQLNAAFRIGFETEFGIHYNFSNSPFGIQLSSSYNNSNLLFKNFEKSETVFWPKGLEERSLNDDINPNIPSDEKRVISFYTINLGIAYSF